MQLVGKIAGLMVLVWMPVFADIVPVAGNGTGTFSNASVGSTSGNTWTYDSGLLRSSSTLQFSSKNFGLSLDPLCGGVCFTPVTVDIGTLIDTNNLLDNTSRDSTAKLTVNVNFTVPSPGGTAGFAAFTIGMDEASFGLLGNGDSVVDLTNFDGPTGSVIINNERFTVTLAGFTPNVLGISLPPSTSNPAMTELDTLNASVNAADLWVAISAAPVPEPGSILLFGAVAALAVFRIRRRNAVAR